MTDTTPEPTDDAPDATTGPTDPSDATATVDPTDAGRSPGPTPLAAGAVREIATAVPDGEEPAGRCERCGRPFRSERALALHRGEVHDDLDDAEVAAYDEAREDERDELFFFHIRVVVALGVLYAISVVLYMAVLGNNWI